MNIFHILNRENDYTSLNMGIYCVVAISDRYYFERTGYLNSKTPPSIYKLFDKINGVEETEGYFEVPMARDELRNYLLMQGLEEDDDFSRFIESYDEE